MREINIAKVITTKRKEKGVTQDELAEYMGVSKASVSKWETAQSYPDITLLPQLAAYFNISIDELIGYLPQMTKEDINKTYHRLAAEFSRRPFDEVLYECHEVIKKYYSCFPLLLQMAVLLLNHYMLEKEKEKQEAILQEIIDLCIRIKSESDDVWITKQANSIEAAGYLILNKPLDALKLLDEKIKISMDDGFLLSSAYQMTGKVEKAKTVLQVSLYQNLRGFFGFAVPYLNMIAGQPEKFEQALDRFMRLSEIFELEKLDPNCMCQLYYTAAQVYVGQNKMEDALEMLENYSRVCTTLLLPYKLKGDAFFDHIDDWIKDFDLEPPRDQKTIKESALQGITDNPVFSPLHDEPKFKSIVEKLKSFLGGDLYEN